MRDLWLRSVLPLVVQARGTEVLHASAVIGGKGVVALCGVATSGKSTLAAVLRGALDTPLVADDALPFVVECGSVTACALPFRLRLRERSAQALGLPSTNGEEKGRHAPLAAIVVLAPGQRDMSLTRVAAADAVGMLLRHAYCFSLDEAKQQLFDTYARLCALVPVWRFAYPQQIASLSETTDALLPLIR